MLVICCCVTSHTSTYRPTIATVLALMNLPFRQSSSGTACVCFIWWQVGQRDWGLENLLAGWLTSLAAQLAPAAAGSSAVYWLEVSDPLRGPFGFFHGRALGSKSKQLKEPERRCINFYDLSLEVTKCHSVFTTIPSRFSRRRNNGRRNNTAKSSLENTICHAPNRKVT